MRIIKKKTERLKLKGKSVTKLVLNDVFTSLSSSFALNDMQNYNYEVPFS